jgi:hypothetical protein
VERAQNTESYTVMIIAVQKYRILTNYKIKYTSRDINRRLVGNKYQFEINKGVISIDGGNETEF